MSGQHDSQRDDHRHTAVKTLAIRQQHGVPYEVERKICSACARILDERPLKRAAA